MAAMRKIWQRGLAAIWLTFLPVTAHAFIDGLTGPANPTFNLTAASNMIQTSNITTLGGQPNILVWTFTDSARAHAQYPSSNLIVNQGDTVTINLTNNLDQPVSFNVPGFVTNAYDAAGNLIPLKYPRGNRSNLAAQAVETPPGGTMTYKFTASTPGTYVYQSGSNQAVQLLMGLTGALIVRPTGFNTTTVSATIPATVTCPPTGHPEGTTGVNTTSGTQGACAKSFKTFAYVPASPTDDTTAYDREFVYIMNDVDSAFNGWMQTIPKPTPVLYDLATYNADTWFANGREGIDTFLLANLGAGTTPQTNLPNQPYSALPVVHPGERLLLRIVNLGRDPHPLHLHGAFAQAVAVDGHPLTSGAAGAGADLGYPTFTNLVKPGQTMDVIWSWTGENLGYDAFGHTSAAPGTAQPYENVADHARVAFATVGEMTHTLPAGTTNTALGVIATPTAATPNMGAVVNPATANIPTGALPVMLPATPWVTYGMVGSFWQSPFLGVSAGTVQNPLVISANPALPANPISINSATSPNLPAASQVAAANAYTNITSPVDATGINFNNSYFFMWHSHAERELTTLGFFPGGMLVMMEVRPWSVSIDQFDQ